MQKIHNIEQIPYDMLYLPLKGIILKDYYPSVGMRQMSDNDILFDADAWERMEKHMISECYKAEYVGKGHDERWVEYYSDIKDRLIPDRTDDRCYGYHMSDEDFYILQREYEAVFVGGKWRVPKSPKRRMPETRPARGRRRRKWCKEYATAELMFREGFPDHLNRSYPLSADSLRRCNRKCRIYMQ